MFKAKQLGKMWKPWTEGGDRDVPAAAHVGRGAESGGGQGAPWAQPAQGGTHGLAHGLRSEQLLEETMCIQDSASSRRHTWSGSWTQVRTGFRTNKVHPGLSQLKEAHMAWLMESGQNRF